MKVYLLSYSHGKVINLSDHQDWHGAAVFSSLVLAKRFAAKQPRIAEWQEFNDGQMYRALYEYADGHTAALMISEHTVDEYAQEER